MTKRKAEQRPIDIPRATPNQLKIIRIVDESGEDGTTASELTKIAGLNRSDVSEILNRWRITGIVTADSRGRYRISGLMATRQLLYDISRFIESPRTSVVDESGRLLAFEARDDVDQAVINALAEDKALRRITRPLRNYALFDLHALWRMNVREYYRKKKPETLKRATEYETMLDEFVRAGGFVLDRYVEPQAQAASNGHVRIDPLPYFRLRTPRVPSRRQFPEFLFEHISGLLRGATRRLRTAGLDAAQKETVKAYLGEAIEGLKAKRRTVKRGQGRVHYEEIMGRLAILPSSLIAFPISGFEEHWKEAANIRLAVSLARQRQPTDKQYELGRVEKAEREDMKRTISQLDEFIESLDRLLSSRRPQ